MAGDVVVSGSCYSEKGQEVVDVLNDLFNE